MLSEKSTMNICRKIIPVAALAGLLLATGSAQAHYPWLEADAAGARVCYGEAEADLSENSPGKLDGMNAPSVFAVQGAGSTALSANRTAEHFAVTGGSPTAPLLAAEESAGIVTSASTAC
jgi:hypothetical protein